eukprot:2933249-Rhodomonas_salina.2
MAKVIRLGSYRARSTRRTSTRICPYGNGWSQARGEPEAVTKNAISVHDQLATVTQKDTISTRSAHESYIKASSVTVKLHQQRETTPQPKKTGDEKREGKKKENV